MMILFLTNLMMMVNIFLLFIIIMILMMMVKVCFDNRVSTWSDKILWFEVNVEDPDDDYTDDDDYFDPEDWDKMVENNEDTQSLFEIKVEDIKTAIHDVRMK